MIHHVYILYSEKYDKIYIGMTGSLEKRIFAHNHLPKGWTRSFRPWVLIYTEEFEDKSHALLREKELKSHQGREFIRTQLLKR
jgi:putative endonuclease